MPPHIVVIYVVSLQFHLNSYDNKHDVQQAIQYMRFVGGRTHTAQALRLARESSFTAAHGARDSVPRYAFVITDGNSNINQQRTIPEAIEIRAAGVHVFTVSVGTFVNQIELKGIASQKQSDNMFNVSSFHGLPGLVSSMPGLVCNGECCIDDYTYIVSAICSTLRTYYTLSLYMYRNVFLSLFD